MSQSQLFAPEPLPDVKRGDVFALGRHKMMCGDATSKADVAKLLAGAKPTLVVTSPPYADCRDYKDPIPCWDTMMIGAFDGHDFADDVQMLVNLGVIHRKGDWVPYWWGWLQQMRACSWKCFAKYIWDKKSVIPGRNTGRLGSTYEEIFHFSKKTITANTWYPCYQPGDTRNWRTNARSKSGNFCKVGKKINAISRVPYAVVRLRGCTAKEASGHPAQMPVALASFLIRTWKKEGCITYDPFLGSGTTLLAAQAEGVVGAGMEISPEYCAIALQRWQKTHPTWLITRVS